MINDGHHQWDGCAPAFLCGPGILIPIDFTSEYTAQILDITRSICTASLQYDKNQKCRQSQYHMLLRGQLAADIKIVKYQHIDRYQPNNNRCHDPDCRLLGECHKV